MSRRPTRREIRRGRPPHARAAGVVPARRGSGRRELAMVPEVRAITLFGSVARPLETRSSPLPTLQASLYRGSARAEDRSCRVDRSFRPPAVYRVRAKLSQISSGAPASAWRITRSKSPVRARMATTIAAPSALRAIPKGEGRVPHAWMRRDCSSSRHAGSCSHRTRLPPACSCTNVAVGRPAPDFDAKRPDRPRTDIRRREREMSEYQYA